MRARRSLLFVPGDSRRTIKGVVMFGLDVVCLDKADGGENRRNQQWSNVLLRVAFSNVSRQSCGNSFLHRRPTTA
jgi:hypothetical protein